MTLARSSRIVRTIPLLIAVSLVSLPAQADYGGGTGEPNAPYLIYTAEQMNEIGANANDWDKHFKLMADIDLRSYTGMSFNIIGYGVSWFDNEPFTGVFDGNGKRISNFCYTSAERSYIGLFGYVGTSGKEAAIKDLGLIDPNVDAGTRVNAGSLVGSLEEGTIANCYVDGGNISGGAHVGGLVGQNSGTITDCSAAGTVSGGQQVGGLVGENVGGTIINCTSSAGVVGPTWASGLVTPVGGLVGYSFGTIANCYATGDVAGNIRVGGLVGENSWGPPGDIINCYATGSVWGNSDVGGLVGWYDGGVITNCYSAGRVSGSRSVGGLVGFYNWGTVTESFWDIETSGQTTGAAGAGVGKTTAEMKDLNTFMDAGWDFIGQPDGFQDIWAVPIGGGYPILWWQILPPPARHTFSGGTGEPDAPYLISTAEDLNRIGHNPELMSAHFELINDIDLTAIDFFMIGSELHAFAGVFDGNGKKISNFTHSSTDEDVIGLFRAVDGATIKDLGLIDPNVDAGTGLAVGSLAGHLESGSVTACYARGGSVSGDEYIGGLVGSNRAVITGCFTENVSVSGIQGVVGGLVGAGDGIILNCYSTGCVVGGTFDIGGLMGLNLGAISNCYATGNVSGFQYLGGLVGENRFGTITNSFWDTQTSGQNNMCGTQGPEGSGCDNVNGKTTAEMQTESTFTGTGWDFSTPIWTIVQGVDYPRLWSEQQESSKYGGGTGEPNDPYLIYTAEQMNEIGAEPDDWDKHFKLLADIDLAGYTRTDFNIIGYYITDDDNKPFTGVFDGSGHTISNFSYSSKDTDRIGLFGYIGGPDAEIRDLGLISPNVEAGFRDYVGSLIGWMDGGTITGCYARDGTVRGGGRVGGLAGFNDGLITNCRSVSNVRGHGAMVGGLVGLNTGRLARCNSEGSVSGGGVIGGLAGENDGTVTACYATGSAGAMGPTSGGLVGKNLGTVSDCYTVTSVGGTSFLGGLVGLNYNTISKCYSAGRVSLARNFGGLVGKNDGGTVTESFWDIETSGPSNSDGGTGKTTSEMQMESTFIEAGWDFVAETANGTEDIWWILEGRDYPRLWWETSN